MLVLSSGNSPLWGCAGDRLKMVVKVHCGTVLGGEFAAMLKRVLQNSPTMYFDKHLVPVSRATSKWRMDDSLPCAWYSGLSYDQFLKKRMLALGKPVWRGKTRLTSLDVRAPFLFLIQEHNRRFCPQGDVPHTSVFSMVCLIVLVVICPVGFRERSRCFGRWTADFSAHEWSWRSGRWFAARSNTHAGIELFLWCN